MGERTCSIPGCSKSHAARGWCRDHYAHWQRHGHPLVKKPRVEPDLAERFWRYVAKTPSCWIWTASNNGRYGFISIGNRTKMAHRVAYELSVGPIPDGLQLDHLCRFTMCVNPAHLEPVTAQVNQHRSLSATGINARKTHCLRGHPFNEANTYVRPDGGRDCRTCRREHSRRSQRRKKEAS